MFIQDSVSRIMSRVTLRSVYLAVDKPKGDLLLKAGGSQRAETDLHVRSYGERHMRWYADSGTRSRPPLIQEAAAGVISSTLAFRRAFSSSGGGVASVMK